jgi:putative transcriptional regulator
MGVGEFMSEHVVDELYSYAGGHLSLEEVARMEAHLNSCPDCRREADQIDTLMASLGAAPPHLIDNVQGKLQGVGRFEHLLEQVAQLFDLSTEEARTIVTKVDQPEAFEVQLAPGVWVCPVNAGPRVVEEGAFTVLLKLEPGAEFPRHTHGGEEKVLILEGGYQDSNGKEYWRGELDVREKGTSHSFKGLPEMGCACAAVTFPTEEPS